MGCRGIFHGRISRPKAISIHNEHLWSLDKMYMYYTVWVQPYLVAWQRPRDIYELRTCKGIALSHCLWGWESNKHFYFPAVFEQWLKPKLRRRYNLKKKINSNIRNKCNKTTKALHESLKCEHALGIWSWPAFDFLKIVFPILLGCFLASSAHDGSLCLYVAPTRRQPCQVNLRKSRTDSAKARKPCSAHTISAIHVGRAFWTPIVRVSAWQSFRSWQQHQYEFD